MLRLRLEADGEALSNMLLSEGIAPSDMGFADNETWVYDDDGIKGFYTYRIEQGIFPHLVHLCVRRDCRRGQISRALITDFRQKMKSKGYKTAFIHARTEQMARVFEWYFKTRQHSQLDEYKFFLIET